MINFLSVAYEADENGYRVTKMDVEVKLFYIDIIQSDWEIASCSIEIFRFLKISIVEEKNVLFCQVLPVFLGISGPRAHQYYFSSLREK